MNVGRFDVFDYDRYFRDARLVDISHGIAFLTSSEPELLGEGIQKYARRLGAAFHSVVPGVNACMKLVRPWAEEASA